VARVLAPPRTPTGPLQTLHENTSLSSDDISEAERLLSAAAAPPVVAANSEADDSLLQTGRSDRTEKSAAVMAGALAAGARAESRSSSRNHCRVPACAVWLPITITLESSADGRVIPPNVVTETAAVLELCASLLYLCRRGSREYHAGHAQQHQCPQYVAQ
jgi:hypothetical protein